MMDWDGRDIKEGDTVIVCFDYGNGRAVGTVERATPKQLRVNGRVYDRSSGAERGGSKWNSWSLRTATPELVTSVKQARADALRLRRVSSATNWVGVSASKIERICAILDEKEL